MTDTPNANWLAKNDAATKRPIFAVNIDSEAEWYHDYEITGATGDHYKYLTKITAVNHRYDPIRSESSIGGFTFEILTSAAIWNFDELFQKPVIVKSGYGGLDWSDYELAAPTSYIQDIAVNATQTGFVFTCQDLQQQIDKDIFTAATEGSPDVISARDPITFWLQVMMSTGAGTNWPGSGTNYDVLDADQGLAISYTLVDITECELIRDNFLVNQAGVWTFVEKINAKDFFQEDIYIAFALAPSIKISGKMSLRVMLPPLPGWTQANNMGSALTDADILELPKWDTEYRDIVNRINFKYEYDEVDDEFDTTTVYNNATSQSQNDIHEMDIESKGIKAANDGLALTEKIANRYFQRYATLPAKIAIKTKFAERIIEASDQLEITSSHIPNVDSSNFTWTSRVAEVEEVAPDFEEGVINLILRDNSTGGKKYSVIIASPAPEFGAASAAQKATNGWIDNGYYII